MCSKVNQLLIFSIVMFLGVGLNASTSFAQGDVNPGIPTGAVPTTGQAAATPAVGPGGLGTSAGGQGEGVGDIGQRIQLDTEFVDIEDTRNQGFIGVTADRIQGSGFVGRPGQLTAPPLSGEGTFGGGVNDSVQSNVNLGAGGNAGGRGAAGFGAAANGVTITRRSMRSRVRPSFSAPVFTGNQVSTRFNNHFKLQPGAETQGAGYAINIQDRTAFLTGSVKTAAESERLVRQLRLEPGVYKVVNQLKVLN